MSEIEKLSTDVDQITPKAWYLSKGAIAAVAAIIQGLLIAWAGVELSPEDMNVLINVLLGLGTSIAGIVALIGRVKAKQPLSLKKPKE
jgi:hypothetical protein